MSASSGSSSWRFSMTTCSTERASAKSAASVPTSSCAYRKNRPRSEATASSASRSSCETFDTMQTLFTSTGSSCRITGSVSLCPNMRAPVPSPAGRGSGSTSGRGSGAPAPSQAESRSSEKTRIRSVLRRTCAAPGFSAISPSRSTPTGTQPSSRAVTSPKVMPSIPSIVVR